MCQFGYLFGRIPTKWVSIIYRLLSNPRTMKHGPFAKDQEDLTKLHAEEAEKRRLERKAEKNCARIQVGVIDSC